MNKQINEEIKGRIIGLHEAGWTYKRISGHLQIPETTIGFVVRKFKELGTTQRRTGSGRPPKLSSDQAWDIVAYTAQNPKTTAPQLVQKIQEEYEIAVCVRTVGNILNTAGFYGRLCVKKPWLSDKNIEKRYNLSKKFIKVSDENWKPVIFSDESSYELFDTKIRQHCYRKDGTALDHCNLQATVKHGGGKIMVWGCISYHGVGRLAFVENTMNTAQYIHILSNNLEQSASDMGLASFIFQQDGARCHTSKLAMEYFEQQQIELLEWAPQSPDLNPIEHVWAFMKKKLKLSPAKNLQELKVKLVQIWNEIPLEFIQKLIKGMFKRSYEVFKAKGGHISYLIEF